MPRGKYGSRYDRKHTMFISLVLTVAFILIAVCRTERWPFSHWPMYSHYRVFDEDVVVFRASIKWQDQPGYRWWEPLHFKDKLYFSEKLRCVASEHADQPSSVLEQRLTKVAEVEVRGEIKRTRGSEILQKIESLRIIVRQPSANFQIVDTIVCEISRKKMDRAGLR